MPNREQTNNFILATKEVNTSVAHLGDVISYRITLTNISPVTLTCICITDEIDRSLEVEGGSIGINEIATQTQSLSHLIVPDLLPGESTTVDFNVFVRRLPEHLDLTLREAAIITYHYNGICQSQMTSEAVTTIEGVIPTSQDVWLCKQVSSREARIGEVLCYRITIRPLTMERLAGLVLSDVLDSNAQFISGSLRINGAKVSGDIANLVLPNLSDSDCGINDEVVILYQARILGRPQRIPAVIGNEAVLTYEKNGIISTASTNVVTTVIEPTSRCYKKYNSLWFNPDGAGLLTIQSVITSDVSVSPTTKLIRQRGYWQDVTYTLTVAYIDGNNVTQTLAGTFTETVDYPYYAGTSLVNVTSCAQPKVCNPYFIEIPVHVYFEN